MKKLLMVLALVLAGTAMVEIKSNHAKMPNGHTISGGYAGTCSGCTATNKRFFSGIGVRILLTCKSCKAGWGGVNNNTPHIYLKNENQHVGNYYGNLSTKHQ